MRVTVPLSVRRGSFVSWVAAVKIVFWWPCRVPMIVMLWGSRETAREETSKGISLSVDPRAMDVLFKQRDWPPVVISSMISELWFDSMEALLSGRACPRYQFIGASTMNDEKVSSSKYKFVLGLILKSIKGVSDLAGS